MLPRYRWLILSLTWSAFLVGLFARVSIGPLGPFLKDTFHISNTQVGWLVSAAVISYAPALLIAGWLVDRLGVRLMLIAGTLVNGLCGLALFFAPSYQVMFAILLVSGLGTSCLFPAAIKSAMLWFPPRERATALGFNQSSMNAAGIICAGLLPLIAIGLGWRYGFLLLGLVGLVVCLCCATLYHDPPQAPQAATDDRASANPSSRGLALRLLKSRDIWALALASMCLSLIEFAFITHLVLYLKERLLFSAVAAGGLLAMAQIAGAFGKPAAGLISDRLLSSHRKIVFISLAAVASLMFLVLAVAGGSRGWFLYPVLVIMGVGLIGWGGLYAAMAGEMGGKGMAGVVSGATNAITCLGVLIGPPLFGYIVDSTNSYRIAWLAMLFFGAASVVFGCFIRERRGQI